MWFGIDWVLVDHIPSLYAILVPLVIMEGFLKKEN